MSGLCGSCRHWKPPSERDDFSQVVGLPSHADYDNREEWDELARQADEADKLFGTCTRIEMGPVELADPLPLATVMDGSEYMADLHCRAEFGCILHEPAGVTP